jgi:hypothetical protein
MLRFLFSVCLISQLQPRHKSRVSATIDFVLQVLVAMAIAWLLNLHRKVVVPSNTSTLPQDMFICNNFTRSDRFNS